VERAARGALRRRPVAEEDPYSLGVARSRLAARFAKGEAPAPYVGRDADQEYKKRLRAHGSVLLIGEPASGVTRTAFEAVAAVWPRLRVVAPDPDRPDAARDALEQFGVLELLDGLSARSFCANLTVTTKYFLR
jgi:hypothetical protein